MDYNNGDLEALEMRLMNELPARKPVVKPGFKYTPPATVQPTIADGSTAVPQRPCSKGGQPTLPSHPLDEHPIIRTTRDPGTLAVMPPTGPYRAPPILGDTAPTAVKYGKHDDVRHADNRPYSLVLVDENQPEYPEHDWHSPTWMTYRAVIQVGWVDDGPNNPTNYIPKIPRYLKRGLPALITELDNYHNALLLAGLADTDGRHVHESRVRDLQLKAARVLIMHRDGGYTHPLTMASIARELKAAVTAKYGVDFTGNAGLQRWKGIVAAAAAMTLDEATRLTSRTLVEQFNDEYYLNGGVIDADDQFESEHSGEYGH